MSGVIRASRYRGGPEVAGTEPWMTRGVCHVERVDTAVFFPWSPDDVALAQQFCWRCPVRDDCLDYALRNREDFGIWGGKSERARARLRRLTNHLREDDQR